MWRLYNWIWQFFEKTDFRRNFYNLLAKFTSDNWGLSLDINEESYYKHIYQLSAVLDFLRSQTVIYRQYLISFFLDF